MGEAKRRAEARGGLQVVDGDHVYLRMVRAAVAGKHLEAGTFEVFVTHEGGCPKMRPDEGLCSCAPMVIAQMGDGRRFAVAADGSVSPVSTN